jgi:hypothetical protein
MYVLITIKSSPETLENVDSTTLISLCVIFMLNKHTMT